MSVVWCKILGHKWIKQPNNDDAYYRCVRCGKGIL
ncbi:DUF1660 family phage protein [Methanolobus sp. ZRKC4]